MIIEELSERYENEWDTFVLNHPNGTIYHQIGWRKLIQQTYNHTPVYFIGKENEMIVGIIPLFIIKSFFNKKLVSIPYCPYGGVLAINDKIQNRLIDKAVSLTKELNLKYLELRERRDLNYGLEKADKYVSFMLKLSQDSNDLLESFSSSTRRHIRKAEKIDFEIRRNKDIDTFYSLYSKHMRNIGTPTLGYKFFNNLADILNSYYSIATIYYNNQPVSSILLLYFKDIVIYDRGASSVEHKNLNLNYVLFWNIICDLSKQNYTYFDFGRSIPESGTYQFKNGWRPEVIKMQYQYYLNTINTIPNISQSSPKRKMFAKIWKHLPLSLTNRIGGYFRKVFP